MIDREIVLDGNLITGRNTDAIPAFPDAPIDALENAWMSEMV